MHRMYCLTSYLVVAVLFTLHLLSPALLILLCCSDDYGGAYDHGKQTAVLPLSCRPFRCGAWSAAVFNSLNTSLSVLRRTSIYVSTQRMWAQNLTLLLLHLLHDSYSAG